MTKKQHTEHSEELITCIVAANLTGSKPQTIKNWCRSKTTPFPHEQAGKGQPFYVKLSDVEAKLKASPNIESKFHPKAKKDSSATATAKNKDSTKDTKDQPNKPNDRETGPTSSGSTVKPSRPQTKKKGERPPPKPGLVISLFTKLTCEEQFSALESMKEKFKKQLRNVQA